MDKDPITNPDQWMRRSQNLMEQLEIKEEGNSINEWRPDELDHTNELGQSKFSQLGQMKSIQSRPNEFSQTSSSQSSLDEFSQSSLDDLAPIKSSQSRLQLGTLIAIDLKNESRENILSHANPNHGEILRKSDGSNNAMAKVVEKLRKGRLVMRSSSLSSSSSSSRHVEGSKSNGLLLLATNTKATTPKIRGNNVFLKLKGLMACSGSTKGKKECLMEDDEGDDLVVSQSMDTLPSSSPSCDNSPIHYNDSTSLATMQVCNVDVEERSARSPHPNAEEESMRDLKCDAMIAIVVNDVDGSTTLAIKANEGDGAMTSRNAKLNEKRGSMTSRNFENNSQLTLGLYAKRMWAPTNSQNLREDDEGSTKSINYPTQKDKLTLHSRSMTRVPLSINEKELIAKPHNPNEEEASTIFRNLGAEGHLAMHASRTRVPLRSLLDESRQLWSSFSSFSSSSSSPTIWVGASCPWDSWEEPTSALDPLCCVCMVGLKGAAFTSCGHTFCRKCSREVWKGRGTCPLCNTLISGILDIY